MTSARPKYTTRFVPLVFFISIVFLSCLGAKSADAPAQQAVNQGRGSALAYTPQAIWPGGNIAERLGVSSGAIYLIDRSKVDRGGGKVVGNIKKHWAYDAKLSPAGDLVAFHGRALDSQGNVTKEGIGVLDLNGRLLTFVPRGVTFAWNPKGTHLAMTVLGMSMSNRTIPHGLVLWSRKGRSSWASYTLPSRVGWARDSLLLQIGDRVEVFNRKRGRSTPTGHHGTVVSPDGLYSMWPGEGGANTRIIEDETNRDVTRLLFGHMEKQGLHEIRSAFWVQGEGADHLLCVSGSDHVFGENPSCKTAIVDAETGKAIAEFPGEALGPTGNGRKTVVLRHESDRFETVDLEGLIRHRGDGGEWY
jgi:hypothetical protein